MVVVNRFASTESRITTLLEILKVISSTVQLEGEKFHQLQKQLDKQSSLEEATE
jgi:pyruvate-formate lyase-activating enzyme